MEALNQLMETLFCPHCQCQESELFVEAQDFENPTGVLYALRQCQGCGLVYQNPRPSISDLPKYYSNENYYSYIELEKKKNQKVGILERLRHFLFEKTVTHTYGDRHSLSNALCAWIGKSRFGSIPLKLKKGKILDIGCGDGVFLDVVARLGWEAHGVEINEEATKRACAAGLKVHAGDVISARYPENSFDVVRMWSVLEHTPNPKEVLAEIEKILKPDGIFVLQVPNIDSKAFKWFGPYWTGLDLPRHLIHYSPKTLPPSLEKIGFKILKTQCVSVGTSWASYKYRAKMKKQGTQSNGSHWSDPILRIGNVFLDRLCDWMGKGDCMVVLAQKKSQKKRHVLAVSHVTHGFGCAQAMEKFLTQSEGSFTFITHPLYSTKDFRSTCRLFEKGERVKERHASLFTRPEPLRYFKDALLTFVWGWKRKHDLFIGMNCLVSSVGIVLRRLGRVKKVIYYTADYSGRRFANPLLNKIYEFFDCFAVKHADMVWNVSRRIEAYRWEQGAAKEKTLVVPNTVDFDFIPKKVSNISSRRHNLVYVGGLNVGYGLEEFVDLLPWILQAFPKLEIDIIGGGALEETIRKKAIDLGCVDRVHFHGYMPYQKALEFLSESSIGFAPYAANLDPEHYLRYCDPSKVKAYMACGCTVIIRNVPELAQLIAEKRAGWVYETKEDLQKILQEVFSEPGKIEALRQNAFALAEQFDNRRVFERAFDTTFKRWEWS